MKTRLFRTFLIGLVAIQFFAGKTSGQKLLLGSSGKTEYAIIVPANNQNQFVSGWLKDGAKLITEAFRSNGFTITMMEEGANSASKPGIYIGDTKLARENGFNPESLKNWSYVLKTSGKNLIIAGKDNSGQTQDNSDIGMSLGTIKGICDFLRDYAGTRFLYPGNTGIEFLKITEIAVPSDLNKTVSPALQFNYALNWKTGVYEIANNMFPPAELSKAIVDELSVINEKIFPEGKFYRIIGQDIAYCWNWGTYHAVGYTPKKTPRFIGAQMKNILNNKEIKGIVRTGFGESFGLEGPVYYLSGRLADINKNISADEAAIVLNDFYKSAFGQAAPLMQQFYDDLYHNLELYSEWTGTGGAGEYFRTNDGSRMRYTNDPIHLLTYIYPAKVLNNLDKKLNSAMQMDVSSKIKQRLELVRMELDYLKSMMKVIHLYNSYRIAPDDIIWKDLLGSIDSWNAMISSFYDKSGKMKTIQNWPELIPFNGDPVNSVSLKEDRYLARFSKTPFAWNTKTVSKLPENQ